MDLLDSRLHSVEVSVGSNNAKTKTAGCCAQLGVRGQEHVNDLVLSNEYRGRKVDRGQSSDNRRKCFAGALHDAIVHRINR